MTSLLGLTGSGLKGSRTYLSDTESGGESSEPRSDSFTHRSDGKPRLK